jgi:hypothetical protein
MGGDMSYFPGMGRRLDGIRIIDGTLTSGDTKAMLYAERIP